MRLRAKLFNYCQRTLCSPPPHLASPIAVAGARKREWNARERRGGGRKRERTVGEKGREREAGKKGRLSLVTLVLVQRRIIASLLPRYEDEKHTTSKRLLVAHRSFSLSLPISLSLPRACDPTTTIGKIYHFEKLRSNRRPGNPSRFRECGRERERRRESRINLLREIANRNNRAPHPPMFSCIGLTLLPRLFSRLGPAMQHLCRYRAKYTAEMGIGFGYSDERSRRKTNGGYFYPRCLTNSE